MMIKQVVSNPERRLFPRVMASFPVQITLEHDEDLHSYECTAINIALGGIQIEASRELVDYFKAQKGQACDGLLNFTLPGSSLAENILCKLLNYRRLSQRLYTVSLSFTQLGDTGEANISQYIANN